MEIAFVNHLLNTGRKWIKKLLLLSVSLRKTPCSECALTEPLDEWLGSCWEILNIWEIPLNECEARSYSIDYFLSNQPWEHIYPASVPVLRSNLCPLLWCHFFHSWPSWRTWPWLTSGHWSCQQVKRSTTSWDLTPTTRTSFIWWLLTM